MESNNNFKYFEEYYEELNSLQLENKFLESINLIAVLGINLRNFFKNESRFVEFF